MAAKKSPTTRKKEPFQIGTLFDLADAKTKGMKMELPSDPAVVKYVVEEIKKSYALVERFDTNARAQAIRELAVALNGATQSLNIAVFSREKTKDDSTPELFTGNELDKAEDLFA